MSKNQYNKLEYVAQKPSFLSNFGRPADRDRDDDDLPSRPKDGKWARGSDDGKEEDEGEGDEWEQMYGGGEGPQVVVLREGKHLSADEVARERRRAAGLPSPPPEDKDAMDGKEGNDKDGKDTKEGRRTRPTPAGHKRKLVGEAVASASAAPAEGEKKTKKKKKAVKGLLSFDEAEGE